MLRYEREMPSLQQGVYVSIYRLGLLGTFPGGGDGNLFCCALSANSLTMIPHSTSLHSSVLRAWGNSFKNSSPLALIIRHLPMTCTTVEKRDLKNI